MLDPTSSFLDLSFRFSRSSLTPVIWLEHAQIIGKESWPNREHVLFLRACSVSQSGHTDRWTHGQTDRWTSAERSNVGLAHARPQLVTCCVNVSLGRLCIITLTFTTSIPYIEHQAQLKTLLQEAWHAHVSTVTGDNVHVCMHVAKCW